MRRTWKKYTTVGRYEQAFNRIKRIALNTANLVLSQMMTGSEKFFHVNLQAHCNQSQNPFDHGAKSVPKLSNPHGILVCDWKINGTMW